MTIELSWREVEVSCGLRIPTSMTPGEADELWDLARGQHVLELGSAYGYSAVTMAPVAKHVLAVDPHDRRLPLGGDGASLTQMRGNIYSCGCTEKVTIMVGYSQSVLPALLAVGAQFGLVFVDADHSEEAVYNDVSRSWDLLQEGGVLACHDYGEVSCPGVKAALDAFARPDRLVDTLWVKRRVGVH